MSYSEGGMNVSAPCFYMTPCQIKNEARIEPTEPYVIGCGTQAIFRKDRNKINEDSTRVSADNP